MDPWLVGGGRLIELYLPEALLICIHPGWSQRRTRAGGSSGGVCHTASNNNRVYSGNSLKSGANISHLLGYCQLQKQWRNLLSTGPLELKLSGGCDGVQK